MKTAFTITIAMLLMLATSGVDHNPIAAQAPGDPAPVVQATEVDVKLSGLEQPYAVGDLIEIDAVVSGVDDPNLVTYDWKILPEVEIKKWPDGSKILLGTGPVATEYTIFLAVGVLDNAAGNPSQKLFTRIGTVTVKQEIEPDSPVADEPPVEEPPVELGEMGKEAVRLIQLVRVNDFYSQDDLKKDARALSGNFRTIAAQLRSEEITTLEQALNKTREFNRGFPSREQWAEWFNGLSAELIEANDDDKLDTPEQIAIIWDQIANGLSSL